jgi:hypothetical protein
VALAAPLLWITHNARAHGDAFHFLARVAAYKRALEGSVGGLEALAGYPLALLREEPEICILAAALFVAALARRSLPRSLPRVALALGILLATLTAAALPGGAPTHHAGRALLAIWLTTAVYVGAASIEALSSRLRLVYAALVAATLIVGAAIVRPWYARLDSFTARHDETAIGGAIRELLPAGARVLLEVRDYSHFAVQAAAGGPSRVVLDRRLDPRLAQETSSFGSTEALARRLSDTGAIAVAGHAGPATEPLEPALARAGAWGLWAQPSSTIAPSTSR